jgi:hypothetical protein
LLFYNLNIKCLTGFAWLSILKIGKDLFNAIKAVPISRNFSQNNYLSYEQVGFGQVNFANKNKE